MTKTTDISVGDRVRFSSEWLRSTFAYTSPVGHLRGTVTDVRSFRSCPALVTVKWDQPYFEAIETRVLATNLDRIKS